MTTPAMRISRTEEEGLLAGWLETTQFDDEPAGLPPLLPEEDDEGGPEDPERPRGHQAALYIRSRALPPDYAPAPHKDSTRE